MPLVPGCGPALEAAEFIAGPDSAFGEVVAVARRITTDSSHGNAVFYQLIGEAWDGGWIMSAPKLFGGQQRHANKR